METLCTPICLFALGTALAGILLFGVAPYLPAPFPAWITRFVGLFAVCSSLPSLWVATESFQIPGIVGGISLFALLAIHLLQVKKRPEASYPSTDEVTIDAPAEPVPTKKRTPSHRGSDV